MTSPKETFLLIFLSALVYSYYIFSFGRIGFFQEHWLLWPVVGLGILLTSLVVAPIAFVIAGITAGIRAFVNWFRRNDYCLNQFFPWENKNWFLFETVDKAIVAFDNELYILKLSAKAEKLYRVPDNELAYNELVSACADASLGGVSGKLTNNHQRHLIASVINLQFTTSPRTPTEPIVEINPLLQGKIYHEKYMKRFNKANELIEFLRATEASKPDDETLSQELIDLNARIQDVEDRITHDIANSLPIEPLVLDRDAMRQELSQKSSKANYPFFSKISTLTYEKNRLEYVLNHKVLNHNFFIYKSHGTHFILRSLAWDFKNEPFFIHDISKPSPIPRSEYSQCFVTCKMLQQLSRQDTFFQKLPKEIIKMIAGMSFSEEVTRREAEHIYAVSHL